MTAFPKRQAYRNPAILKSAKGEDCTIVSPWCSHDNTTVVFCHLNESYAGKGAKLKADDIAGFYGCHVCHSLYDGAEPPPEPYHARGMWEMDRDWYVLRAYYRTIRRLIDKGVLR